MECNIPTLVPSTSKGERRRLAAHGKSAWRECFGKLRACPEHGEGVNAAKGLREVGGAIIERPCPRIMCH